MHNLLLELHLKGMNFVMGSGWADAGKKITDFFNGDNDSLKSIASPIGYALVVIGLISAVVSFAWHHYNQQARFPSWTICFAVAVVGGLLININLDIDFIKSVSGWFQNVFVGGN